jgi:MFS family permease
MNDSLKRSPSVTAAAVVAILGSLFLLLCCSVIFFGILSLKLTGTTPEPPPFVRTAMLATQGFMMGLCLFGIATGIGLIYLRNWARISILTWGGLSVFFGAIGIPIGYFALSSPLPNAPALPAEGMQVRWILLLIYGLPLLVGMWWLILFNRKSVKAQFTDARVSADLGVPQKPACPLPIAVLAWFYIASILNLLFLPFLSFHVPVFVFGRVLPQSLGLAVLILSCLAFLLVGIGLLKLKLWSYSLTIGLQLFWLASTVVTVLSPNYGAVMDSFMKEMQASLALPETQFSSANFTHHYGWTVILGLLFAGAILGLFVYYRPRFLEEASKASSAS